MTAHRPKREGRFWPRGAKQARENFMDGTDTMDNQISILRSDLARIKQYFETIKRANDANARAAIDDALTEANVQLMGISAGLADLQTMAVRMHTEMSMIQQEPDQPVPAPVPAEDAKS
jgi:predicted transcriptional regulator